MFKPITKQMYSKQIGPQDIRGLLKSSRKEARWSLDLTVLALWEKPVQEGAQPQKEPGRKRVLHKSNF